MDGPINFSATERSEMDNKAEIYSIILATELLERAFIRDAISPEAYTPACLNLIAQFKTAVALLPELSIDAFMAQYRLDAPAAKTRLLDFGVPATYQHATNQYGNNAASAKHVAETVQLFITLMDSIKLNLCAVDQLHPLLSDLIQSLNRVSSLPSSFTGKEKVGF